MKKPSSRNVRPVRIELSAYAASVVAAIARSLPGSRPMSLVMEEERMWKKG